MFDSSAIFRASLRAVPSIKEALFNFEKAAEEYHIVGRGDFDCWVRWGCAIIDVRDTYKLENNNKPPSRKQMTEYCKKYKISPATGYRWLAIAMYELPIRQRMGELGRKAIKQSEILEWVKQWKKVKK